MLLLTYPVMRFLVQLICLSCPVHLVLAFIAGDISSPLFPDVYPPGKVIKWNLTVPPGFLMRLQFQVFDLAFSQNCQGDNVALLDGERLMQKLCGNATTWTHFPRQKEFVAATMNVIFTSVTEWTADHQGFYALYEAIDADECAQDSSLCEMHCMNYIGGYYCFCSYGYELNADKRTCKVVDCGPFPEISGVEVVYLSQNKSTTFGMQVQLFCAEPYYEPYKQGIFTCEADGIWRNEEGSNEVSSCIAVCGRPISPPFQFQRIFGGRLAARGNFPWQVYFHSPRGGGILISDQWIMTAANMLREDHFELFAGIVDISEEGLANAVKLQIADKFIHPNYTYAEKGEIQYNYNNDIALLKLTEKVKVGQFLSPICLLQDASDTELENGKLGYISGWGLTEKRKLSNDLRYAEVPVVNMDMCKNVPIRQKWVKKENFVFTPNMFCAGAYGLDNCHGDGGGAFAILNDQDRFFVEGIVSWGFKCGTYSVYTKVVNYLEWITKTMSEN
ncbi:complement C1s subcomponent-like [Erpetoichthys calabaricus]|uniref:complement C1s subcomponent-like n=1 Tax=Erpetoichthys calabaricus TaxID=27687 RepID=UPI002234AE9A|nr:complement C1s subcomponent-like [Erpetoichthys calabaricus]